MNDFHPVGGGLGGAAAVVLAALGSRIGLRLSDPDAAALAIALLVVGGKIGHAFASAWGGAGLFPSLRRGIFGPARARPEAVPVPVSPTPPTSQQ